jgi:DNA modification methylase
MGAEPTLMEYVERLVVLFRELRRALKPEGVAWLNLGDSYANDGKWGGSSGGKHAKDLHGATGVGRQKVSSGLKPKDLCLVPYRVALALQADGWWLRDNIVWHKPNPMPASVTDRCTSAHEAVFLLTKSARYWFDQDAIREPSAIAGQAPKGRERNVGGRTDGLTTPVGDAGCPAGGRNKRNVWTIPTRPYSGSHYAVMPPALVEPCIKAGCPAGGVVLDPFGGSGTVAEVAESLGRKWLMFDLDERNVDLMKKRTAQRSLLGLMGGAS